MFEALGDKKFPTSAKWELEKDGARVSLVMKVEDAPPHEHTGIYSALFTAAALGSSRKDASIPEGMEEPDPPCGGAPPDG